MQIKDKMWYALVDLQCVTVSVYHIVQHIIMLKANSSNFELCEFCSESEDERCLSDLCGLFLTSAAGSRLHQLLAWYNLIFDQPDGGWAALWVMQLTGFDEECVD